MRECAVDDRAIREIDGLSIVIIGAFNPAIFHPSWFSQLNLLGDREIQTATDDPNLVVSREATQFVADWFVCQVLTDRLQLSTAEPDAMESLRDIAHAVLTELPHTPLSALGINRDVHWKMPSEARWHALGDFLVPKTPWARLLYGRVGLRSLLVQSGPREDQPGATFVKIEPSTRIDPGVYVGINQHFQYPEEHASTKTPALWAADTLVAVWKDQFEMSSQIATEILDME